MVITRELLEEMVAHAREEYDAECCGMVAYERGQSADGSQEMLASDRSREMLASGRSRETLASDRGRETLASDRGREALASDSHPRIGQHPRPGQPRAVRVHRARNVFATDGGSARKRFEIDGREVLRVMNDWEEAGLDMGAIYHSHTHTAPYPSQTDINFARNWPGVEWVIVGLAGEEPEVRCYLIDEGEVREVPIEVA